MSSQVPEKHVAMQRNYHEYVDQEEIYNNIPSMGEAKTTWRYLNNLQGTRSQRAIDRRQARKYRRQAIMLNYKSIQERFEPYTRFVYTGDKSTIGSFSDINNKKWTKAYVMYLERLALTKAKTKPMACKEGERLFKYCSKQTIINKTTSKAKIHRMAWARVQMIHSRVYFCPEGHWLTYKRNDAKLDIECSFY